MNPIPNNLKKPFDRFMRNGGHQKINHMVYKRGSKIYRINEKGEMNSNLYGRWKIFLSKWLEHGKEYLI